MTSIGTIEEWQAVAEAQSKGASQADGSVHAMFYTRAVPDKKATENEGRAVFNNVPYVEIRIAGQPKNVVDRAVTDEDKKRFPRAWAAYEAGQQGVTEGTPIEHWPYLQQSQVAELRAAGVRTIEQLAEVSDGDLGKLGHGGRKLRERAQQHLKGADETERQLREQLAEKDGTISNLEARMRQLEAKLEELAEEKPKRGPGRPRKEAA